MSNRIFGIAVTVAWLACMAVLVQRDVLPDWFTQSPPDQRVPAGRFQYGIHREGAGRIGAAWIVSSLTPNMRIIRSTTELHLPGLTNWLAGGEPMLLDTTVADEGDDGMDTLDMRINGLGVPVHLSVERYGADMACTAQIGDVTRALALDAEMSQHLGDTMRPFTHLTDLRVGQTWHIRMIDPLSLITGGTDVRVQRKLVRVTAREEVEVDGRQVACHRIETENSIAWADATGEVIRQEVKMPLAGTWVFSVEPFDQEAYDHVLRRLRGDQEGRRSGGPDGNMNP